MMPCPYAVEDLSPYIDGELEADKELSLRDHLANCATCQQEIKTLTGLKETVTRAAVVYPLPPTLRTVLHAPQRLARRPVSIFASLVK